MRYSSFLGDKVSRIGFGAMRLPMDEQGKIDYDKAAEMVDYALANGINYFDTAYNYHRGEAEKFCGSKLVSRHPRESFYLASKMPTWLCNNLDDVKRIFEKQLDRCQTNYFDFYLLHSVDEESWPPIPAMKMGEYLVEEKKAGRIRHLGISVHCEPALLKEILDTYGDILEFVQLQINYMDWENDNAKELYDICREYKKPVTVMEPLRGGMLANPMSSDARTLMDDISSKEGKPNTTYADYAFGFTDTLENVAITLSGMSDMEALKANIEFFSGEGLTKEQLEIIPEAASKLKSDIFVPCTGCNYCYECPAEIKISEIFKVYNDAAVRGFHNIWGSLSGAYKEVGNNAADCIHCGSCESHCPQKIKITDELARIHKKYIELEAAGE